MLVTPQDPLRVQIPCSPEHILGFLEKAKGVIFILSTRGSPNGGCILPSGRRLIEAVGI